MHHLAHFVHSKPGDVLLAVLALIAAKYLLDMVGRINYWLLVGNRAAQRAVRADLRVGLTINTVLISLARYLVYFVLLGWVLTTLGVSLSHYLASVSFLAIAIGFGSQGLVQDVVTGFFLVFERQMNVGDMVVINGQTGIVEVFGLRFTEVRLYDGSRALMPNRMISQVINYRAGAVLATLDVVATGADAQRRAVIVEALHRTTAEVEVEFAGVVRAPAVHLTWTETGVDGGFARSRLAIWPGQTWVVDGQWVPRLKARLAAAGVDEAQYQVAVYYGADPPAGGLGQPPPSAWPRLAARGVQTWTRLHPPRRGTDSAGGSPTGTPPPTPAP